MSAGDQPMSLGSESSAKTGVLPAADSATTTIPAATRYSSTASTTGCACATARYTAGVTGLISGAIRRTDSARCSTTRCKASGDSMLHSLPSVRSWA